MARARVVIAGGGVAALEALMTLSDLAAPHVEVTVVSHSPNFLLRPQLIGAPWGGEPLRWPLSDICRRHGATFRPGSIARVDAAARRAVLTDGTSIPYDELLVATGCAPSLPYIGGRTVGFGTLPPSLAAPQGRIAVIVPPGTGWSFPAYQFALLMAERAPGRVEVVTHERVALGVFGAAPASAAAILLRDHHVMLVTRTPLPVGSDVSDVAETVVALPLLRGPGLEGLPADRRGFIPVDAHMRVTDHVHAAGDATAIELKQGGLAAQQASVAAEDIAAHAGAPLEVTPYIGVLRGKLVAPGDHALYLRRTLDGVDPGTWSHEPLWQPEASMLAWRLSRWLEYHRKDLDADPLGPVAHPSTIWIGASHQ